MSIKQSGVINTKCKWFSSLSGGIVGDVYFLFAYIFQYSTMNMYYVMKTK